MTSRSQTPDREHTRPVSLFTAARGGLRMAVVVSWGRALLNAAAALVIGRIVDLSADGDPPGNILLVLAGLLLTRSLFAALPPLIAASTATRVETDLRRRLLDSVLAPGHGRRTGILVGQATEGVEAVGGLAGSFLPQLIGGMSIPLLLGLVIAVVDPLTAVVLVLVLPLIPALLRLLERRFASVSVRYRETADQLAARFLDGIQGLRTLKVFDRAEAYGDQIAEEADRLRVETMGLLRVNQLALLAVDTLFTLGTVVAAAGMAAWRLSADAITVGEGVTIVLLGVLLIEPLSQIGRFFYVGAIGRAAAAQIREVLDTAPPPPHVLAPVSEVDEGMVEFDQVSYTYPLGSQAVDRMTFRIERGEKVALVGRSGSGKSTIAHLILGLLQPDQGTVRVGGRPVLITQRPFLFHGTVAENLRLARPDATDEELWAALGAADLADVVTARPEGLDSQVGERGLELSGGEVQRLAIARAMLVDVPIVVLDEPTSNVDLDSEVRIREALDRLNSGRTVIIIAHRRTTIAGVDRVLLIDSGQLEADAAPSQLVGLAPGRDR